MRDTEDWENDDFQTMESEACGALAEILDKSVVNIPVEDCEERSGNMDVISEKSVQVILDSSSGDSEEDNDGDFVTLNKNGGKSCSTSFQSRGHGNSRKQTSVSEVMVVLFKLVVVFQVNCINFAALSKSYWDFYLIFIMSCWGRGRGRNFRRV